VENAVEEKVENFKVFTGLVNILLKGLDGNEM